MSKLDPLLKYYAVAPPGPSTPAVSPLGLQGAPLGHDHATTRQNVMVEIDGDQESLPDALIALDFVPRTRAGNVFTGDIPRGALPLLEGIKGLKRAEASRGLRGELDVACSETGAVKVRDGSPPHRGAGVIVAIIDHGVDYRHPSFRNADGTSRILAIWDQGLTPGPGEASPAGFGYGVEYKRCALNAALQSAAPLSMVRHRDSEFHGTHTAGVAAGSGEPASGAEATVTFVGVAPDADLIVVANTRTSSEDPGSLGDSADTLDAIHYILDIANRQNKPVVINQSQGDNIGPHDGTSLLEVGIANLITGPGRVFVKSAGNQGNEDSHAEGLLTDGPNDLKIDMPPDQDQVIVDLWYLGDNRIGFSIIPPGDGAATSPFQPPFSNRVDLSNGNRAFVDSSLHDPGNRDNRIFVIFEPGTQDFLHDGTWTLRLSGNGRWHAWIQIDSDAKFVAPSRNGTISIPGTTDAVITVGAYATRPTLTPLGHLSKFSACGPTRDGRRAPTLCAPGEELEAPLALLADGKDNTTFFNLSKGTSISAPMVAGAVALMLEINRTLTAADIRQILERSARKDDNTGPIPNDDWGAGKLDVKAACELARTASP